MGHCISGFVALREPADRLAAAISSRAVPLACGYAFAPLPELPRDAVVEWEYHLHLWWLTQSATQAAKLASADHFVGYVETEYFGGIGGQGAVVWLNGLVVYGPAVSGIDLRPGVTTVTEKAIPNALRMMGVVATSGLDEFDTVGLGRHRSNESWLAAIQ